MNGVVIDSSVFIDDIRRGSEVIELIREQSLKRQIRVMVPSAVILELWSGSSMIETKVSDEVRRLYGQFEIIPLTEVLAIEAGKLVGTYKIKAIDAVIAATALAEKAWLATLNRKDFVKVPDLRLWE